MPDLLKTIFFLIAVIDPVGSVPVYLEATKQFNKDEKRKIAVKATLIAALVLLFFIVVGQIMMEAMTISLDAFQVSGGVILFLFALTMIFGEGKPEREKHSIKDYKHVIVFPIAIPSIASPGAIMAVVMMTDNNLYSIEHQTITSVLVMVVLGITCLLLLAARFVQARIGEYGITVISKVMGLILVAFAAQSLLTGLKGFFNL